MKIILNLCQQRSSINKIIQNCRTIQVYRATPLTNFDRLFHNSLFINENCLNNKYILWNVYDLAKRNATKKAKSKKKGSNVKVDLSVGSDILDLNSIKDDMIGVSQKLSEELRQKYATKLAASTLDNIRVTIDGERSPLYEVAEVRSGDKEFTITCVTDEVKDAKVIMKAIQTSLNISPRLDGSTIKVPASLVSSEYKEGIAKLVKESAQKSKERIRDIRQKGMVKMKKQEKSACKDTMKLIEKQLQTLTDIHSKEVQDILSEKLSELDVGR